MISVEGLKVEFNATPLFEDVSYVINKKDRIALVGKNGAGKSTMLKILAGLQQPTSGVVAIPRECTIGYLPQVMILSDKRTVMQEAELAFEHIFEMQADIERMNRQLAERTDYDSEEYHKLIDRFTHENERFLMMGGTNFRAEIERTLQGLGFSREDFDRSTSEFSGGWRMRIELAKLLLRRPDVLLLDEPTNHLDIESIQWLENFLSTRANAVVLVSHDRAFLNNVTTRTIEITCGQIYDYKVKYDEFVVLRKERREQQLRAYENQQKQIEDTEAFIERFRYKATKAVQVQSRIKQLEKTPRKLIRKVARLATHYNSKFVVLHVQTRHESADRIPLAKQRYLINHFKLASELGGEVLQIQSDDIIGTIINICRERQISTVCVGKPNIQLFSYVRSALRYKRLLNNLAILNIDLIILGS